MLDGSEDAFALPDEGSFLDTGTIVSLDNPNEGNEFLDLSTLGGSEDLFSNNVSPGLGVFDDVFDDADPSLFFGI